MNFSKTKIVSLLIVAFTTVALGSYVYAMKDTKRELDTKSIKDPNNEYIINPNLEIYKKYEWATWQDSAGGRLAHDPAWFKLPAEKYIPKEVPFNWNLVKGQEALVKRDTYFEHLCKTESVGYRTSDYPEDSKQSTYSSLSTWLHLRVFEVPVKNMKETVKADPKKYSEIMKIANQNPYINPGYGFQDWSENMSMDYFLRNADEKYYKNKFSYNKLKGNTFREYLLDDGRVFRNVYDLESGKYLPLKEIKLEDSQAQYYTLKREIKRPEMEKLGIYGSEVISFDRKNNKLISYSRLFRVPLYLDSMQGSGQSIPINWAKGSNCAVENKTIIDSLEN